VTTEKPATEAPTEEVTTEKPATEAPTEEATTEEVTETPDKKETVKVTGVELNKDSLTLYKGDKAVSLTKSVSPENAEVKSVTWASGNKKVATVDNNGNVKPVGKGTTKIIVTVTGEDGSKVTAVCNVTVKLRMVSKITLQNAKLTVLTGKKATLKVKSLTPGNASNTAVTWSLKNSKDSKYATVNSKTGVVTAKKAGTVTIVCKAADGSGTKATCKVTIRQAVEKIKISKTKLTLKKGKKSTLKVTSITPKTAANRKVTWTSSNTRVAKVDSNGKVTAVGKGKAIITCKAKDGSGVSAKCTVTVIK
jgi:uncharacterized protein YjdB